MLSSHLRLGLPSGLLPSGLPTKMLYVPLTSPMRATCPAHHILRALITLTILGEEYKPCSSSLCSFLQPPVTSSLALLNMFKITISLIIVLLQTEIPLQVQSQLWKLLIP
jgi:hypothetical protein